MINLLCVQKCVRNHEYDDSLGTIVVDNGDGAVGCGVIGRQP